MTSFFKCKCVYFKYLNVSKEYFSTYNTAKCLWKKPNMEDQTLKKKFSIYFVFVSISTNLPENVDYGGLFTASFNSLQVGWYTKEV